MLWLDDSHFQLGETADGDRFVLVPLRTRSIRDQLGEIADRLRK